MPRIGKRICKSSLAVFLCFMIYLLRGQQGIVFYSCIAAVLCVQSSTHNTIKVARNRIEGTLIGGFVGMGVLVLEKYLIPQDLIFVQYLLISLMIIVILYLTVILKKTSASYISCVVFMSVTVAHGADVNPYLFALDRILDTLIGIFVAFVINVIHLPCKKEVDALYMIDYEAYLQGSKRDPYVEIKLCQLQERGAHIALLSEGSAGEILKNGSPSFTQFPLLCMHGSYLYDVATQTYLTIHIFSNSFLKQILQVLTIYDLDLFQYSIIHDVLHIYYGELMSENAQRYYEESRKQPYENYVYGTMPSNQSCFGIMMIEESGVIDKIEEELNSQSFLNKVMIYKRNCFFDSSLSQLYICALSNQLEALQDLMNKHKLSILRVLSSQEEPALKSLSTSYDIAENSNVVQQLKYYFYHPKKK